MSRARGKDLFSLRGAAHRAIILASSSILGGIALHPIALHAASVSEAGTVAFNIRPQPLASALTAFGTQTGWAVSVPNELLIGLNSPGVQGRQAPVSALVTLLVGTGLSYHITGARSVIVQKAAVTSVIQLGPVRVQGQDEHQANRAIAAYAGGQVAQGARMGLFGNRSLMDTPFNVTSYTSKLVADQQARGLLDVMANDASVRAEFTETGFAPDFSIRGFLVSTWDISLDGLFGLIPPQDASVDFADRIEVLKGPSAFLNGMPPEGSIGGTINIVPKRAENTPITRLTFSYLSGSQFGGKTDLGRRFGKDGAFGIRLNGSYRGGDLAVKRSWEQLGSMALALDYRSDRFRSSIDLGYERETITGSTRPLYLDSGVTVPKAPSATSNWLQPWTRSDVADYYSAFKAEYDLTRHWTVFATAGLHRNSVSDLISNPTLTDNNGTISVPTYNFPQQTDVNTEKVGMHGDFSIFGIKNNLSIDMSRYVSVLSYGLSAFSYESNLYSSPLIGKPTLANVARNYATHTNLSNIAIGDTISFFHDRFQVFAGGRWQKVETRSYSRLTGDISSSYNQGAVTPAVGVVIKLQPHTTLYGNYIQGLQQGMVVSAGYANAGQIFAPYKSTQLEIGLKHDFGKMLTSIDYFQITQPSAYADASTNTYVRNGSQRNRGFEFNATGKLTSNLRLIGGAMWINGVMRHTAGGTYDGNQAVGTPHLQLNSSVEWDIPYVKGVTVTGRSIYTSSQYYDAANTQKIPNWVRFDIGARYTGTISRKVVTFRGDIHNIGGRNYWSSALEGLTLGAPRTFFFSATADF